MHTLDMDRSSALEVPAAAKAADLERIISEHSPMVYRVCLRMLGDPYAAEDATQATFLVLIQRLPRLSSKESLAGWLHRTAVLSARTCKRTELRHATREKEAARSREQRRNSESDAWDAACGKLDEALNGIPAREREALVLCVLEGLTREQAARRLGVPEGTVASRTGRGLERLRRRFAVLGLAVPVRDFGSWLAECASEADIPAGLISTLHTGAVRGTGKGAGAGGAWKAAKIAEEVVRMTTRMTWKWAGAFMGAMVLASGLGLGAWRAWGQEQGGGAKVPTPPLPQPVLAEKKAVVPEAASEAVNGLRVSLQMKKTELLEGEPWAGDVILENAGKEAFEIALDGGNIQLVREDGKEPNLVMCIGTGGPGMKGPNEPTGQSVKPGARFILASFNPSPRAAHNLSVCIGGRMLAWDLTPGDYRIWVDYGMNKEAAVRERLKNPWLGQAKSNVVKVRVAEKKVEAVEVKGLVLVLEEAKDPDSKSAGGRAKLKNVSKNSILVDLAGGARLRVKDADGKEVAGMGMPIPMRLEAPRAKDFVKIEPGEWQDVMNIHYLGGAMMVQSSQSQAYGLPNGAYTFTAVYSCEKDEAAKTGVKGSAWTGNLSSNEIKFKVEGSPAPKK